MYRRKLTIAEAYRAIGMLESGQRQVDVAQRLGVSQSVISRLSNRERGTGSVKERVRSGRPIIDFKYSYETIINDTLLNLNTNYNETPKNYFCISAEKHTV